MVSIQINNDRYLDLGEEVVGISYQEFDLGNIESPQGTFTNDFKIPETAHNCAALGYATIDNIRFGSYSPYTGISARCYQDGVLISKGVIQINEVSDGWIDITFYGDNVDIFQLLKGKKLREIDLSDLRHTYTAANVISSFTNTSGYVYLPIDYGLFTNRSTMQIVEGEIYTALYFPDVLAAIFKGIGYKVSGTLLNRALFKKSVLPFCNNFFGYSKEFVDEKNFYADNGAGTFTVAAGATVRHNFSRKVNDFIGITYGNTLFNLSTDRYTADDSYQIKVTYGYDFRAFRNLNGSVSTPTLYIKQNGVTIATSTGRSVTATVTLAASDYLEFEVLNNHSGSITFGGSATGDVSQKFVTGSVIYPETVLPDMDQSEFLKWVMFRFLSVMNVDLFGKTVYLNQFNDIRNNPSEDWSSKIDASKPIRTNYSKLLSGYAKVNKAIYTEDENDSYQTAYNADNSIPFGAGQFELENDFLESEKTIFETPFSPTLLINSFANNELLIPYIPRHLIEDTFIEFGTSETTDGGGRLQLNISNAPSFKVGDTVEIQDASEAGYNGIWTVYTKIDNNNLIITAPYSDVSTGTIRFDNSDVNIPEPRVLTVYGNLDIAQFSQAATINIMGTDTTSIPFSYFYKQTLGFEVDDYKESLAFGAQNIFAPNDVGAFESDFLYLISILQNPVLKEAHLKLNQIDLVNLDHLKKKYFERLGGYFYLNIINEYDASGDSVECELIKV